MNNLQNIPSDFDYKVYIYLNKDLLIENDDKFKAEYHYQNHGYEENRKYKFDNIPLDFDWKYYLKVNSDVKGNNIYVAKCHYENHGRFENRQYKEYVNQIKYEKDDTMNKFLHFYKTTYEDIISNPKTEFRFICFKGISYMKNLLIPEITIDNEYEAVLIEFRFFPHIEFLIRTAILKLDDKWSHTIICGTLNYHFMVKICSQISKNIKIIKTNYENLSPSKYSKFIASSEFWHLLSGKKILIYQEDAIIFKKNINEFLKWDYIGAPWPENSNNNNNNVGNGGLSLRTKDIMLKIINKVSLSKTKVNHSTLEYMKNTNSSEIPEDVYFSKNMEDLNIGQIADRNAGYRFSSESIFNENSFGGHNFWISNLNEWRNVIYKNNIISFKPNYDFSFLEHRGGWRSVIETLINTHFYSDTSPYDFFDMMENQFLWKNDIICKNKWSGILHCTNKTPEYLNMINIEYLFLNHNFIESLKNCFLLFTLSTNVADYMKKRLKEDYNINIPIYTLKLPVIQNNIPCFDMNKFLLNNEKKLIQIGQQLRKVSSIYLVNSNEYEKWWLTGSKNFEKMIELMFNELKYLNIPHNNLDPSVKMYYTQTYDEYDELLTQNIIFIDFFDTAANTAIVECIIRGTPIIVNKIGGIVEYLGEDYPLYFDTLEDVPNLLNIEKIKQAHEYLVNLNKEELSIDFFLKKINTIIYENI